MLRDSPEPPQTLWVDHLATLNRRGQTFHFDNFYIARAQARRVRVHWSVPRDATGIRGYSLAIDRSPSTTPDTTIDSAEPEAVYADLAPGMHYVHVRASDGAGNWGPAGHARIDVAPRMRRRE